MFISITYLPLVVLSFSQNVALPTASNKYIPLLFDVTEMSRFLLVAPLLLVSESVINPWIKQVLTYIRERRIDQKVKQRFERAESQLVALQEARWIPFLLLATTFLWQFVDATCGYWTSANSWQELPEAHTHSYAWFWYAYFAKPLVRFLWLRWIWKYLVWIGFLVKLSRFDLKIIPTHPDRAGGLGFILVGHSKFAILAFTLAVQASSILANQIIFQSKNLWSFRYEILGMVNLVLLVFLLPFLVFSPALLQAKRAGLFEYGALSDEYVARFRRKWIESVTSSDELLGTSDLQSLADLDNSYNIVREMKTCLITKETISIFVIATLIPFAPLLLSVYPFDDLLKHLLRVLV